MKKNTYLELLRQMSILERMPFGSPGRSVPFNDEVYQDRRVVEVKPEKAEGRREAARNGSAKFADTAQSMMTGTVREVVADLRKKLDRDHLVKVEAPAWTGKTILTRHVARLCRDGRWPWLPIYLPFRELSQTGQSLPEYMRRHYGRWFFRSIGKAEDDEAAGALGSWLYDQWITGPCLLIVDGADEEFDPGRRREALFQLVRSLKRADRPRVLLTSRPLQEPTPQFVQLELKGFQPEQMRRLIAACGKELGAAEKAAAFSERVRTDPQLQAMGERPGQLVQMLAAAIEGRAIGSEEELMAWVAQKRLDIVHGESETQKSEDGERKRRILESVGFHLLFALKGRGLSRTRMRDLLGMALREEDPEGTAGEAIGILEDLTRRSGFLRRTGGHFWGERYEFDERRWLEFFAASHAASRAEPTTTGPDGASDPAFRDWLYGDGDYPRVIDSRNGAEGWPLRRYLWRRGYHDVLILMAARLTDATRLLEWMRSEPDVAHWMLALRTRMACRAPSLAPIESDRIGREITEAGAPDRRLVTTLKSSGNEVLIQRAEEALIAAFASAEHHWNRWGIPRALGELGSDRAVDVLIAALAAEESGDVRKEIAGALGELGSERAVDALIAALHSEQEVHVRQGIAEALGALEGERVVDALIAAFASAEHYWNRWGIPRALGELGSDRAVHPLIVALHSEQHAGLRREIAEALGALGGERAVGALIAALPSEQEAEVHRVIVVLEHAPSRILEALIPLLRFEQDARVRSAIDEAICRAEGKKNPVSWNSTVTDLAGFWTLEAIARVLRALGREWAVDPLIGALGLGQAEGWRHNLWAQAFRPLGECLSEQTVKALIAALGSERDAGVRWGIVRVLAALGGERALEGLIAALHSEQNAGVRRGIAEGLGALRGERVVETLIMALRCNSNGVAETLGWLGEERAVEPLILALGSEESLVRGEVATALGKLRSQRAVDPLIGAFGSERDEHVRWKIADALGQLGSERAVDPLIAAFASEKDGFAREIIAKALGELGSDRAVDVLIAALGSQKNLGPQLQDAIVDALRKLGSQRAVESLIAAFGSEEEDSFAREEIARALRHMEFDETIASLIERRRSASDSLANPQVAALLSKLDSWFQSS